MSQKSSDFSCIPLCLKHHRTGPHSYHSGTEREFEAYWDIKVHDLAAALYEIWLQKQQAKAA
jgi:hypothetical protein